jgi:hypothetical protein
MPDRDGEGLEVAGSAEVGEDGRQAGSRDGAIETAETCWNQDRGANQSLLHCHFNLAPLFWCFSCHFSGQ